MKKMEKDWEKLGWKRIAMKVLKKILTSMKIMSKFSDMNFENEASTYDYESILTIFKC